MGLYTFTKKDIQKIGEKTLEQLQIKYPGMAYLLLANTTLTLRYFDKTRQEMRNKFFFTNGTQPDFLVHFEDNKLLSLQELIKEITSYDITVLKNCIEENKFGEGSTINLVEFNKIKFLSDNKDKRQALARLELNFNETNAISCELISDGKSLLLWQKPDGATSGVGAILSSQTCRSIIKSSSSTLAIANRLKSPSALEPKVNPTVSSRYYFHADSMQQGLDQAKLNALVKANRNLSYLMQTSPDEITLITAKDETISKVSYETKILDKKLFVSHKRSWESIEKFANSVGFQGMGIVKNCIDLEENSVDPNITDDQREIIEGLFNVLHKELNLLKEIETVLNFKINISGHPSQCKKIESTPFYLIWQFQVKSGGEGAIVTADQIRKLLEVSGPYLEKRERMEAERIQVQKEKEEEMNEIISDFAML